MQRPERRRVQQICYTSLCLFRGKLVFYQTVTQRQTSFPGKVSPDKVSPVNTAQNRLLIQRYDPCQHIEKVGATRFLTSENVAKAE